MKKSHLTFAAILLCTCYGILSWDIVTHSAPPASQYTSMCSTTTTSASGAPNSTPQECCIDYHETLDAAKHDWEASLQQLMNQEKAASEMVDDGYESLRTYNCWVEYVCLAVQYSGHAPVESSLGTGLTSEHIGRVPGCQAPEDLKMEKEYNKYTATMTTSPIPNKINFFPRCMTDPDDNKHPYITQAKAQYDDCKAALEINFGCPAGMDQAICEDTSTAFVTLENALKKRSADQKASALEKKLSTLVPKLQTMETHVGYLSNFLQQLDARFSCYAGKCT